MSASRAGLLGLLLAAFVGGGCVTAARQPLLTPQEHNDLGVAYQARGEIELALREYRRALAQDPTFTRAWINLGNASLDLGKTDEALAAYERARELAPSDPEVLNNLAWALHLEPRSLERAERLIRDALGQNPTPRHFYLDTLGAILVAKGALEEAGAILEEGLRLAPPDDSRGRAALSYHLGLLRLAQARPAEAGGFLRDAIRLDPRGPFADQARKAMEPLADK